MHKILNSLRNKTICIILALGLAISSLVGLSFNFDRPVHAATNEISITNYDFNSVGTGTPPALTSGWSKVTENVSSESNIVSGIFNAKDYTNNVDEYLEDYKLFAAATPGTIDNDLSADANNAKYKSLMINAPYAAGKAGYKTSSNIPLNAGSFYRFNVVLKTITATNTESDTNGYATEFDSRASIYVRGLSDSTAHAQIEMIDSSLAGDTVTGWATYSIYIQTKATASENVTLELWLGSEGQASVGAVFFNSVSLTRFSKDAFEKDITSNGILANKQVVRLGDEATASTVTNGNFDQAYNIGWTTVEASNDQLGDQVIQTVNIKNNADIKMITNNGLTDKDIPTTSNLQHESNNNALLMYNPSADNYAVIESEPITIRQHGYYRLSVWAYCNSAESTAPSMLLVDKSDLGVESALLSITTSVSTSTSSNNRPDSYFTGDWTEYAYYIYGPANSDATVALRLQLGTKANPVKGYVFFDDVELRAISYQEYSAGESKSNTKILNYNTETTNFQVENDDFDITQNADSNITYPLLPSSWKANTSEHNSKSGVINTDATQFDANLDNYSEGGLYPHNPGTISGKESNNNVLMIGNLAEDMNQYYTSNAITLASKSYYKFTAQVATNAYSTTGGANLKLYTNNQNIFEYTGLRNSAWKQIVLYIATGENSLTVNIDLGMTAKGYAFFDEILVDSCSESAFNDAVKNTTVNTINLQNESFENISVGTDQYLFTPSNYTGTNHNSEAQVEAGVADLTHNPFDAFSTTAVDGKNALYINTDTDTYYAYTSNANYTLDADKYYKLTTFVQTNNIHHTSNDADGIYGASIRLNYGDKVETFYGIDTASGNTNGWKEYSFYIKVQDSTTATLELALGSEKGQVSGLALFDNITLSTIEQTEYDNADNTTGNIIKINTTTSNTDNNEQPEDTFDGTFDWYLIPSLITAVAILIALVGSVVKKINWKRGTKVETTYDRRSSLDQQLTRREQIETRKEMIANLQSDLDKNEKAIKEFSATSEAEQKELQQQLNTANADLLDNIKAVQAERTRLEHERNSILAQDKASLTAEQEQQYQKMLKSVDAAEEKYTKQLSKKQKQLTQMQQSNTDKLNSMIAESEFIRSEINKINSEIDEIRAIDTSEWVEQKQEKLAKKAKKQDVEDSDIEITPPKDNE